jgi:hypothetical protein
VKALTSIAPNPTRVDAQRAFLASWRMAGLEPVSFNHASEFEWLKSAYPDVEFVGTERTAMTQFGKHLVRVNTMLDWIAEHNETALLINADLRVQAQPAQFEHLGRLAKDGMPYLLQYNCYADGSMKVEPCGISAFVVHPLFVKLYGESFLCFGKPWWDYWVPFVALRAQVPLYCPTTILAFHTDHQGGGWSEADWLACAVELDRMTGALPSHEHTMAAASRMSAAVYAEIVKHTTMVVLEAVA